MWGCYDSSMVRCHDDVRWTQEKYESSQELSRMFSVEVQGGLQETLFPNFCSELKVIISFNELDTNASQAALFLVVVHIPIYHYTIVTK